MAQDDHAVLAGLVLFGEEGPTVQWRDGEDGEEARRDPVPGNLLGRRAAGQVVAAAAEPKRARSSKTLLRSFQSRKTGREVMLVLAGSVTWPFQTVTRRSGSGKEADGAAWR
jgi:hypothetical protein